MKKYYIEIVYRFEADGYIMQSVWFDTEEKAIEWAKNINYVNDIYDVYLMGAEWQGDTYGDILVERILEI